MPLLLTGGNARNHNSAFSLLAGPPARNVVADKAHDSHTALDHVEAGGARPIIPQRTGMPRHRAFDPVRYRLRDRIERSIGKLKQHRRIATRYDRLLHNCLANLYLDAILFRA